MLIKFSNTSIEYCSTCITITKFSQNVQHITKILIKKTIQQLIAQSKFIFISNYEYNYLFVLLIFMYETYLILLLIILVIL